MTLIRPLAAAALALAFAAPAAAEPVRYRLLPDHSFVHFEVRHFGTSTSRGRFGPVDGEVTLDRTARSGQLGLRIRTATVDTGVRVFDSRLREPDLLGVEAWPEAYFVASRFEFDAAGGVSAVRGEFTLRGIGQPLTLVAERFGCRSEPAAGGTPAREVCGGEFVADVLRSAFGATFGLPFIADRVRLRVQVEAERL